MKILSAPQIRELDAYTIKHEPITSLRLMERASREVYQYLLQNIFGKRVFIFCGMGNNGGDGLALARMFSAPEVQVYVVKHREESSKEFATNLKRLARKIKYIEKPGQIPDIPADVVVLDAIFGSGLSRPADGIAAAVIGAINKSKAMVISVDVPSGMFCDRANAATDAVVKADLVLTFHAPKLSFLLAASGNYIHHFEVLDIGLNKAFAENLPGPYHYLERNLLVSFLKKREKFSHKGTYGHALMAAGSLGKMGAAILALKAAVRSGAGLVSAYVPGGTYPMIHTTVPEVMIAGDTMGSDSVLMREVPDYINDYSAIGTGPGIGTQGVTGVFLESLLNNYRRPIVLDADALNILAADKTLCKKIPAGSILTPHPGEFKRLAGEWKDDLEKLKMQSDFAVANRLVVVLKGAHTSVAMPDGKIYFNSTGNPGMAKGGSGDVLTGVLTSILAQGYTPEQTALLGVYVHGLAGDLAKKKFGDIAMNAGDIVDFLPQAFMSLGEAPPPSKSLAITYVK